MEMRDVHNTKRRIEGLKRNLSDDQDIIEHNKQRLFEFMDYSNAIGLKETTIAKDTHALLFCSRALGNTKYDNASRKDYERILSTVNKQDWSEETKRNCRIVIKKFVKWLRGIQDKRTYPEEVAWIPTSQYKTRETQPEELITKEEFEKLISTCNNSRDKFLLMLLFETGMRIGECLNIRIKDVFRDEDGNTLVKVNGKTGIRTIPLVASLPVFKEFIETHPFKDDKESFLFMTDSNRNSGFEQIGETRNGNPIYRTMWVPLSYDGVRKIIRTAKEKANIKKRIYSHLFRYGSASDKAGWMTDRQLMSFHGWSSSAMIRHYSKLTPRDLVEVVNKHYKTEEKEKKQNLAFDTAFELLMEYFKEARKNPRQKAKLSRQIQGFATAIGKFKDEK